MQVNTEVLHQSSRCEGQLEVSEGLADTRANSDAYDKRSETLTFYAQDSSYQMGNSRSSSPVRYPHG